MTRWGFAPEEETGWHRHEMDYVTFASLIITVSAALV